MNVSGVSKRFLSSIGLVLFGFGGVVASLHPEDAARIIVSAEGGVVRDVVVAEAPSGRTYLLAVWAASEGHMPAVVLYRSFAGGFVRLVEEETNFAPIEALELVDLDGDGTPEAYWQINSFGNARGGVFYTVHDVERTSTCGAVLDYAHGVPSNDVQWNCEATRATVPARAFIGTRIEEDPRFARADATSLEVRSPEDAVRSWRSRYLGFAEGLQDRVTLEPFELPFGAAATSVTESTFAKASHGGFELFSQFKGPVFGVDHARAVYWVVLSPPFPHDWIRDIRVLGECFVLDDESGLTGPPIAYHPVRHELVRDVVGASCGVTASASLPDATTALLRAIQNTNGPAFEAALAAGADVNGADEYGQTPLMYAVDQGQLGMSRRLLDLGADVGARSFAGWSALHYAARGGDDRLVAALLEAGANPVAVSQDGATPLDVARIGGGARDVLERALAQVEPERGPAPSPPIMRTRANDPQVPWVVVLVAPAGLIIGFGALVIRMSSRRLPSVPDDDRESKAQHSGEERESVDSSSRDGGLEQRSGSSGVQPATKASETGGSPVGRGQDPVDDRYAAAFVRSYGSGLRSQFARLDAAGGYVFGFHWVAGVTGGLVGPLWFIYRKMYGWAVGLFLVNGVLNLVLPVELIPSGPNGWSVFRAIATALLCGGLAHFAYWQKVRSAVRSALAENRSDEETLLVLSRRGGTNLAGAILVLVLVLAVGAGLGVLAALGDLGLL